MGVLGQAATFSPTAAFAVFLLCLVLGHLCELKVSLFFRPAQHRRAPRALWRPGLGEASDTELKPLGLRSRLALSQPEGSFRESRVRFLPSTGGELGLRSGANHVRPHSRLRAGAASSVTPHPCLEAGRSRCH